MGIRVLLDRPAVLTPYAAAMRIHFCLADMHGPGYYRGFLPLSRMSLLGHNCTHATAMPTYDIAVGELQLDVLIGQRLVEPSPSGIWQKMARREDRPFAMVMDLDDDLWNIDRSNDAHSFFDPDRLRRLRENVSVADLVTVSTDYLADVVAEHTSAQVIVLENTVPESLLELKPDHAGDGSFSDDDVVIGWAGSSTHDRDFGECAKSIKRIIQANPRTIFHCVCSKDYTPRVQSIRGRTKWTSWVNGVENYYKALNFDIGLAPLYPFEFNNSKSDLRLLELGALGMPVIASPVGPYKRALEAAYPAYPASTPKEWTEGLNRLVSYDRESIQDIADAAREWVRKRTTEANVHRWVAAYEQVLSGVRVR